MCSIVLLLITGVLPVGKGLDATAVYTSPVMILLLGLLSASSIKCCFRRRSIGFYLVHVGAVVILLGAFIGYVASTKGKVQLRLNRPVSVDRLGSGEPFGFEVTAKEFEVEFYPPIYHLYQPLPPETLMPGQMPFKKVAEYDTTGQASLDIDGVGRFEVSNLWNPETGEWVLRRMLDSGAFLQRASQTPSHYGVLLQITDGKKILELPVRINHPAVYNGWRFYLMSYDPMHRSYVVLTARRDPGRNAVIAGIWAVIIGTFVLCFSRQAPRLPQASEENT